MEELVLFGLKVKIVDDSPKLSNCRKCIFAKEKICIGFGVHPCTEIDRFPSQRHFEEIK